MTYSTLVIDPPWPERGGGKSKRGADRWYSVAKVKDLPAIIKGSPLWQPAASCSVWLWATANYLEDAMWLLGELGATYVTNVVWVKPSAGLGQRVRMQHEHLLYGRIGSVPVPPPLRRWPSVQRAERVTGPNGRPVHSAKPQVFFRLIEEHGPEGRRAELFSRSPRAGWDCWGDQLGEQK